MIDEFSKIMEGINACHVMLLVDKMTFKGSVASISRYSMRSADSGPFSKASFEETLSNFLDAGVYGQEEPIKGASAAIICGKRAPIGTGLCNLEMDIEKLACITEEDEGEEGDNEAENK
jgi:DNA-directed RNA polymerase beta' subunit